MQDLLYYLRATAVMKSQRLMSQLLHLLPRQSSLDWYRADLQVMSMTTEQLEW